MVLGLWFLLVSCLILIESSSGTEASREFEGIFGLFTIIISISLPVWWLFRKRKLHTSRREAKTVATVFAVVAPLVMVIATPVAQLPGSYAALLGRPFGLIGALVSIWIIVTLFSFLCCSLVLWIVHRRSG